MSLIVAALERAAEDRFMQTATRILVYIATVVIAFATFEYPALGQFEQRTVEQSKRTFGQRSRPRMADPERNSREDMGVFELPRAIETGKVTLLGITGNDLSKVSVELESTTDEECTVTIASGTMFKPKNPSTQNMVVLSPLEIRVVARGKKISASVQVACANMKKNQPTKRDSFELSDSPADFYLRKLFASPAFNKLPFSQQQFAVWTITDNPSPAEYKGIGGAYGGGSKPSLKELREIRDVFREAGLEIKGYKGFRR